MQMKTLIRIVKDYDKNIRDCHMHFLKYLFEKKGDPADLFPSFF